MHCAIRVFRWGRKRYFPADVDVWDGESVERLYVYGWRGATRGACKCGDAAGEGGLLSMSVDNINGNFYFGELGLGVCAQRAGGGVCEKLVLSVFVVESLGLACWRGVLGLSRGGSGRGWIMFVVCGDGRDGGWTASE